MLIISYITTTRKCILIRDLADCKVGVRVIVSWLAKCLIVRGMPLGGAVSVDIKHRQSANNLNTASGHVVAM